MSRFFKRGAPGARSLGGGGPDRLLFLGVQLRQLAEL